MIGYKRVTTEEELRRKDLFFWSDGHRCSSSCSDGTYIEVRPSDSAADALSVPRRVEIEPSNIRFRFTRRVCHVPPRSDDIRH